jgi:hypothetical protein
LGRIESSLGVPGRARDADRKPDIAFFNPHPAIECIPLGGGRHGHIVDDALLEPERFVEWAVAHRDGFRPVDFNAYPGVHLMPPEPVDAALASFSTARIRSLFDARRLVSMHCRLSMLTRPPHALRPYQWLCHSDRGGLEHGQSTRRRCCTCSRTNRSAAPVSTNPPRGRGNCADLRRFGESLACDVHRTA